MILSHLAAFKGNYLYILQESDYERPSFAGELKHE